MDKDYWKNFYQKHTKSGERSLFANFVYENYLAKQSFISSLKQGFHFRQTRLLELGCGNGRDALFFAKKGIRVVGIDQVSEEIAYLQNKKHKNANFIASDFTKLREISVLNNHTFECIYSRFTLHSISLKQQENLLLQLKDFLAPQGIFAIEARGYKNALYKKGEAVKDEADAFIYDNHYRRFINVWRLCEILQAHFDIAFAAECRGFAPFQKSDDYFFRIIAINDNAQRERERE